MIVPSNSRSKLDSRDSVRSSPERSGAVAVSWEQVHAFRADRHHLTRRAPAGAMLGVLAGIGGAQAQLLSAAQLSLANRVRDLTPDTLDSALLRDRTLARAWCMRRTVHLLPSEQLATFVRGTTRRADKEVRWMRSHGVPENALTALLDAVLRSLDEPVTRSELAVRVSRALGVPLRSSEGGGWGSRRRTLTVRIGPVDCPAEFMLHLVGTQGVVCAGPSRSGEATFVRADAWLPGFRDVPVDRAEEAILRTFLRAFGPATVRDFVAWTQMTLRDARPIWERVAPEMAPVDVEGWDAWVLQKDRSALTNAGFEEASVRLLPYFDTYLLGHEARRHFLEEDRHARVYRAQGWVAPVLLVNGRVRGTWNRGAEGGSLRVDVRTFARLPNEIARRVRSEARELGRFLGSGDVQVAFSPRGVRGQRQRSRRS